MIKILSFAKICEGLRVPTNMWAQIFADAYYIKV